MKSILFIVNNISELGGIEKITISLSNELRHFFNVNILDVCNYDKKKPYYCLNDAIKLFHLKKCSKMYQLLEIKRLIKKQTIDTIIIQSKSLYYFSYIKNICNKRIVFVDHDSLKAYPNKQKNEFIPRKRAIKRANTVVSLTEENKNEYLKRFKIKEKKIIVIGNYVDAPTVDAKYNIDSKVICAVGRYHIQKRFDLLIKAFSIIANKYPDWTLKIYGDGVLKTHLQEIITVNGLTNRISLCGKYKSIEEAYTNKSFYVMSSEHEGFGISLLEALTYKLPVISFNTPSGPSEIIYNNKNGILVPMLNIESLANAMETLINNENLRIFMSDNSYLSTNSFSKEKIISQWIAIL